MIKTLNLSRRSEKVIPNLILMPFFSINAPHIHLLLNHFPIILSLFGSLLLAYGLWTQKTELVNIALSTFVIVSLIAIPVFLSGDETFDIVSSMSGINTQALVMHEKLATWTFWLLLLLGIVSAFALYFNRIERRRNWYYTVFFLAVVTTLFAVTTGYYWGSIRHSEEIFQTHQS